MKKTFLITGAAGFIGSNLCNFLLKQNFKVIGIDNLSTGKIENLNKSFKSENFKFLNIDITTSFEFTEKINYIFHFASAASPIDYLKKPIETLRAGSIGTENILKICLKNKATILIASTSEVYGDPKEHPQTEEYNGNVNPIGPRGVYDEAKRFQEALTTAYHTYYGLDIRIARIFNTYGPNMRINDGRALPAFISQALSKKNLTVFGDGKQTRSFCYISDLIDGLFKLLMSNYTKPVNLGNPDEISLNEFAEEIIKLTNSSVKIEYKTLPVNDPKRRKPDISKAKKILDWSPKISRNEGLNKTIKYFLKII
jgi:dTDP-glucose 4,6-dehydratase